MLLPLCFRARRGNEVAPTSFVRSLLTRVPKSLQDMVATLVRSIFMQSDAETDLV
jgi:hypothetical protein